MRRRLATMVAVVAVATVGLVPAASATIHEIVQSECSAKLGTVADLQIPPGVTGGSNADNFAQPLEALLANGRLVGSGVSVQPFPGAPFEVEILINNPAKPGKGPANSNGEAHCKNPQTDGHPDAPGEVP